MRSPHRITGLHQQYLNKETGRLHRFDVKMTAGLPIPIHPVPHPPSCIVPLSPTLTTDLGGASSSRASKPLPLVQSRYSGTRPPCPSARKRAAVYHTQHINIDLKPLFARPPAVNSYLSLSWSSVPGNGWTTKCIDVMSSARNWTIMCE